MPDVRLRLLADVRDRIARARGVAGAELVRAERQAAAAREARDQRRRDLAGRTATAAARRDSGLAAAADRHRDTLRHAATAAGAAAALAAPGAAGTGWSGWLPTATDAGEPAPLVRIGTVTVGAVEVPALVGLLDRGHVVLAGDDRLLVDQVLTTLLTRSLGSVAPGSVQIFGYDPEHLGGRLAAFAPLVVPGLLSFAGPRGLGALLDELVDEVHRIGHRVLAGEYPSLRERAAAGAGRPEPWRIAVLLGDGGAPGAHEVAQLRRLLRTGAACGVHVICSGVPFGVPDRDTGGDVTTVSVLAGGPGARQATVDGYRTLRVALDPPAPPPLVADLVRSITDVAEAGPPPADLARLLPERFWTRRSAGGLTAPIGEDPEGRPVLLRLADQPPHALIGGPTGSGKTNLIFAWLAGLTTRYSPDELELYLLDFKEGVSFARFAPTPRDPTWLPHVRLVGLNVNTDREFGIALLRHLGEQLRTRAEAAKRHGVTKIEELREEDPGGRWPRIVAIIDEFQVLFGGRDALTAQAVELLEDLARRGRSQGIHLVLASQDVSGIEALWGRSALLAQLTLRIALPKARRILAETNPVADEIPRHHAVVNTDSGVRAANQVVRVPDAGDRGSWTDLLGRLAALSHQAADPGGLPRLFDGDAVPLLDEAPDFLALRQLQPQQPTIPTQRRAAGQGPWGRAPATGPAVPVALLGEAVDVRARSVAVPLGRSPGRNVAVLGAAAEAARSVLAVAARSLARQYPAGAARLAVAVLDDGIDLEPLRDELPPQTGWYCRDTVADLLSEAVARLDQPVRQPEYLLLYAVDAAAGAGGEALRKLLHHGPERDTHVLGWWRSVARLRDDLGGIGARFDAIGAWVALDVHGSELAPLSPSGPPPWYPRPWRALVFDRSRHRSGEVMIPYREPR